MSLTEFLTSRERATLQEKGRTFKTAKNMYDFCKITNAKPVRDLCRYYLPIM